MIGRIIANTTEKKYFNVEGRKSSLHGLSTYVAELSLEKPFLSYRLGKLVALWEQHRVSKLLLPEDFPLKEPLEQLGFSLYDPLPTLQTLGDCLLLQELCRLGISPQECSVKLCGAVCDKTITTVAVALCPQVATVAIDAVGAECLAVQLYQQFGMAVPSLAQQYTATISFSLEEKNPIEKKTGVFLQLDRVDSPDFCGISPKKCDIPEDVPPLSLLGLLLETGKISREEIDFT